MRVSFGRMCFLFLGAYRVITLKIVSLRLCILRLDEPKVI